MQVIRAVGREAAAKKYDLLSAMMAHGLAGDKHRQRLVLRLMALITTRYNWQRDELTIGQREIARLWCVDERTVKREMAKLRALGWIEIKQQGARGRVSVLGLNLERILLDTKAEWENIGPDFVTRLTGAAPESVSNVVPLHRAEPVAAEGVWGEAQARLAAEDRALFDAWFAGLAEAGVRDGCLTLFAPTRFHASYVETHLLERLRIAVQRSDGSIVKLRVLGP
ncbi:DnaA N-terminal domain-containing protein [Paracoccus aminovorans]|uniref:DnaA N-terminal domain-containing protein n=1 Tax=Paracoccus aminovorans TaxID=34004 RepID=A0A1I2Z323_9RHOB|nr:DnaA N-terminal domain-containing protein [Paracoccus aminovorans]CQR83948.1 DNA replication initiator protein [Paracoccus aminovorans]SFH32262.1 DnaA N-terminal domain-containing protein [Paracoccus aminovorans]